MKRLSSKILSMDVFAPTLYKALDCFQGKGVILENLIFPIFPALCKGDGLSISMYHQNNFWILFSFLTWWGYHSIQWAVMCILVHKTNEENFIQLMLFSQLLFCWIKEYGVKPNIKCFFRKSVRGTSWLCSTF